ncbi:MAG: hypothetical protein RMH84_02690, partial [Sulfolobales archaeon]|nr:hypothetical protein [Sulfolobales archaeon]MDW8010483.1 hypothetical protein [Sulfolobales archaeon]
LADSLMVERRTTLIGSVYVLRTVVGEFQLPASLVEESGQTDLLSRTLSELENALERRYEVENFKSRLRNVFGNLSNSEIDVLAGLYDKLLKLEKEGRNGVWVSIVRNAFAPMLKGRFDYVVGNPPWVRWESLSEEYRKLSKPLWERYGIVGAGAGFKRDLSMLFLARCFDLYLKPGGRLAFLMPLTVLKTEAGAGFRKFLATKTRILVVHDLVSLNPFEGATNNASAVVIEKVCELDDTTNFSKCPGLSMVISENEAVKNVVWVSGTGRAIPTDARLDEIRERVSMYEAVMTPIEEKDPSSPWMQVKGDLLPYIRRVTAGESHYVAHEGVLTALNQVYYLQIKRTLPDGRLLVVNPPEPSQKRVVEEVEAVVESDLVYPLVRGRDVKRWYVEYRNRHIIIPHFSGTGDPIPEGTFKTKYPGAYGYLYRFKNELMKRSIKPFLSLREKMNKSEHPAERDLARRRLEESFYILDNIGSYTFKPYKVVWRHITRAATGKPTTFGCAVLEPRNGRPTVPNDKLMAIAFDNSAEAHYVAGVLNSSIARLVVATYCVGTEVSTHVVKYVKIPKYDPGNLVHRDISEFSRKAHELARCIYASAKPECCRNIEDPEEELKRVEIELDKAVAKLYGIPDTAIEDIRKVFKILAGESGGRD